MSAGFHRGRALWLALALASSAACSDARQPPQPASFDRPTDVDFVCVKDRVIDGARVRDIAELGECDFVANDRALHALVTQSARGEVAAVNLGTERILDNRRDIPGYTFVRTGELPIAIAVSRVHPELTYVASYGSRDVHVLRTRVLLGLTSEEAVVQVVSLTIDEADGGSFGGTPSDMVLLPQEDALLVTLSDVGKVARLPITASGEIDDDAKTFIDLPVSSPAPSAPVVVDEPYAKSCGNYQLPPLREVRARPAPRAASAARPIAIAVDRSCTGQDTCTEGRVLIADEALPVLHALDLAALRAGTDPLLAPIPTGVPTRDVAVTPNVPKEFHQAPVSNPASTYFVYAIDAVDGSVMVLENDRVLAINRDPSGQPDRLPIDSRNGSPSPVALSLEVITPTFNTEPGSGFSQYVETYSSNSDVISSRQLCIDDEHPVVTPRRLRGVFLSAAMADGTVRIIDVHDRELRQCRDCDMDPSDPQDDDSTDETDKGPRVPILVRHHPRLVTDPIALNEGDRTELRPDTSATVSVRTGQFGVRSNGSVASPLAPSLSCIPCADGFEQALPDPEDQAAEAQELASEDGGVDELETICEQALVCGPSDPWISPPTSYSVSYEAALPNTAGGEGRFVATGDADNVTGLLELHSGIAFCERGVLGRDDIGGARDEAACLPVEILPKPPSEAMPNGVDGTLGSAQLAGDEVVIISEPLSDRRLIELGRSERERETCALVRAELDDDPTAVLGFEIIAAFEDRIAIRQQLNAPFDQGLLDLDWEGLRRCIGEGLVRFFVRSRNGFLVQTGRGGFEHNVIANANGRCVVDAMSGPQHSRRAWTGCQYRDSRIQFQLEPFERDTEVVAEPGDGYGVVLSFGISTTSVPLIMNATQIGFGVSTLVPARLRYSAADQHLYLVDTYQGGLIPIDLDPFNDTPITSFY